MKLNFNKRDIIQCLREIFLVMRITLLLIFLSSALAFSSNSYAQDTKLSLHFNNAVVKDVLNAIENQSEFIFFYQDQQIDLNRRVNITAEDKNVEEILDQLFKGSANVYTIRDRQIIIGKSQKQLESTSLSVERIFGDTQQPKNKTISGRVTDTKDQPIPGASVAVKGTLTGISTDSDGKFSLVLPNDAKILVFSFVGMKSQEVAVGAKSEYMIVLADEAIGLEEVVAVGYGVQKKTSITAAVSSVKGKEIASAPVSNLSNSIGGRLSGVIVKQSSGEPGLDGSSIYIRGISSTGSSQPLIIVDGIPRSFQQIDPNSIESITVLKDAAAEAPYGVAGANGVLLITTKRGKTGAPTLRYNGYVGFQNSTVLPDYVDSYQFATLKNAAAKNDGLPLPYSDAALRKYQDGSDPDAYPNWDVLKSLITPNAILTNHNIELSGGAERIKYYASLGYQYQEGLWSTTNYNRYNLTINLDAEVTRTTKISFNVNGKVQKSLYPAIPIDRIFELASYSFPNTALKYSNGLPGNYMMGSIYNSGYLKNNNTSLYTQLSIEQKIPFISGLMAKVTVAYDPSTQINKKWRTPVHIFSIDTIKKPYVYKDGIFEQNKASLDQYLEQSQQLTYQGSLNYNRTFGKHNIGALAVIEAKANDTIQFSASRRNYNLSIDEINMGSSSLADISNTGKSGKARQMGMVYRLTYDYDGKYLFEASGRYDGSYYFAPENRFGFFPAFSLGWRLSKENFIKDNLLWIDNLKVRASYGEVGALAGRAFQYLSSYGIQGPDYVFGGNAVQGLNESSEPNANITWERAKKTDIGLEAMLWKGLLNIEADYFYEKRSNMLVKPDVVVPAEYGIGLSQVNAGVMENQGIDLSLSSVVRISNDLQLSLATNFTYAQNSLLQVFETASTFNNPNRRKTGKPLDTQFGFQDIGFFQLADFDEAGNLKPGIAIQPWGKVRPGDIRYKDISGADKVPDGKINDDDLTKIGESGKTPQIIYGLAPGVRYKGFSLDLLFQGVAKTDFYYSNEGAWPFHSGRGAFVSHMNYWTPENPNALNPRITGSPTTNNTQTSSFWMQDASYLRLKNATLAYNIPSFITQKIGLKETRIYVSGQNILTWTKVKNFDPENLNSRGLNYPQQKVISVGLNVTF